MEITSPDFEPTGPIPDRYTCKGDDINPPLDIADVPDGTRSARIPMWHFPGPKPNEVCDATFSVERYREGTFTAGEYGFTGKIEAVQVGRIHVSLGPRE